MKKFLKSMATNILTVDVEDNFHFEELKFKEDWANYDRQVVANTLNILNILETYKTTATFFVVGKVAERHPDLIREIDKRKHHIASHSYNHYPIYKINESDFRRDLEKSITLLSKITNKEIFGFRAMGYSIREENMEWVFKSLHEIGITYDSSINPLNIKGFDTRPCYIERFRLREFPLSVYKVGTVQLPFAGGTYLRLLPYKLIEIFTENLNKCGQPVVVYIHPWEFNKDQPPRNVSFKQKIFQHPLTFTTEKKFINLLETFRFCSIEDFMAAD